MAAELKATNPAVNIEIIGNNRANAAAYNSLVTSVRRLPWLQDTTENSTWTLWKAVWRDVRILDPGNRLVAVFNVTDRSLGVTSNYVALRQEFLNAAVFVDTDGDRLLDEWERQHFGDLSATGDADPDGDGENNFSEYAFVTDPKDAASRTSFRPGVTGAWGEQTFQTKFRRRAGGAVQYVLEISTYLPQWSAPPPEFHLTETLRNLYDGSGAVESTCALTPPAAWQSGAFLRVRAVAQ